MVLVLGGWRNQVKRTYKRYGRYRTRLQLRRLADRAGGRAPGAGRRRAAASAARGAHGGAPRGAGWESRVQYTAL